MLRGNHSAKIDDKGRLKVPAEFRGLIEERYGPKVFVTSLDGEFVRIYLMLLGILVSSFFALNQYVVHIVGDIPAGLVPPKLPGILPEEWLRSCQGPLALPW